MVVVHFVTDEKFIDHAMRLADALGHESRFVALEPTESVRDWRLVRQKERVEEVRHGTPAYDALLAARDTLFVLHAHTAKTRRFCRRLRQRRKRGNAILWLPWGHDYAELIDARTFAPQTLALRARYHPTRTRTLRKALSQWLKMRAFLRTVDFVPPRLRAEQKAFRRLLRRDALITEGRWTYYVDSPTQIAPRPFVAAPPPEAPARIMFNHAGLWECNHLDGFAALAPHLAPRQTVVVPLCYGEGAAPLRQALSRAPGNEHLTFLQTWLARDEWWRQINACDIFIETAWRQIANGATSAALFFGKKVFLSERNPFLPYYREMGVRVFSFERDLSREALQSPLSPEEARRNHALIRERVFLSEATHVANARRMFDFIARHLRQA